jgi:hypothetical protein
MRAERIDRRQAFVRPLIGVAIFAASFAASGQQQGQEQRQSDVQVAVAGEQQPQQAMWSEVRIIHVKSDQIAEFEDLIKELSDALAKQGEAGFNIWQVAFGDQSTYHIVSQLPSFAAVPEMAQNPPMEPQAWASWLNRIQSTIDSQELSVAQVHQDLSIMPEQQSGAAAPELLVLMTQTLLPGKRQDYVTYLRNDLLPALRQSGILGVVTNEMTFGTEDRTWVFAAPVQNWSTFDKPMPLFTSMGQQAAQQLLNRGDAMVERSETIVLRARPDLMAAGEQAQQQGQ